MGGKTLNSSDRSQLNGVFAHVADMTHAPGLELARTRGACDRKELNANATAFSEQYLLALLHL